MTNTIATIPVTRVARLQCLKSAVDKAMMRFAEAEHMHALADTLPKIAEASAAETLAISNGKAHPGAVIKRLSPAAEAHQRALRLEAEAFKDMQTATYHMQKFLQEAGDGPPDDAEEKPAPSPVPIEVPAS